MSGRRVNSNKEDSDKPKCSKRYVAQGVGFRTEEAFYAATPPFEAKRLLMS